MRKIIWVRILNVLNLKYERLVRNSAKVLGKFSVFPPYYLPFTTKASVPIKGFTTFSRGRINRGPQIRIAAITCKGFYI